ncbi:Na(+)/H(+) antiporter subunit B [Aquibacillus albus]|uniref:Multicomponent Na+:H+ antiporter subunit B n=1 Tax=Aquibacillus albus TaxID=1168171 RepID=A0ABS2N0S3_9BACI|nr:hydrogenase subunit MbhD domain-containing protein [Aquibacillus albus]MBM7571709.1 multicomponent Na+:H+ antiporter subunit B [Aquibacillus albus]
MMDIIFNMLMIFLVITAFFMVFTKDISTAVIALPIYGAILVVIFVILQAPGPAIAEAVIAAGLTTVFFVITINKTEY